MTDTDEQALLDLGFQKRYILLGHPAWPGGLNLHPPTEQLAAETYAKYCTTTFDDHVARIGHVPKGLTRERYRPRIEVDWVLPASRRQEWRPENV